MTWWEWIVPLVTPSPEAKPPPPRPVVPDTWPRIMLTEDTLRAFPADAQADFRRFEREGWCKIVDPHALSVAMAHTAGTTSYEPVPVEDTDEAG